MVRKLLLSTILLIFILGTTSFASDYSYNGETLPATNSINDDYYGVDTIANILTDFGISTSSKVSYTYYINKAIDHLRETVDSTITLKNICFIAKKTYLYMVISNGSFSNTLPYMAITSTPGGSSNKYVYSFDSWQTTDGVNTGINTTQGIVVYLQTSGYSVVSAGSTTFSYSSQDKVNSSNSIYWQNLLTPIETFTYAGVTTEYGYNWYTNNHNIRFTESGEIDIGGDEESGDTGGGTTTPSGDTGGGTTTPSGDTGGGTTTNPNYSQDLENIQNGITDINNNISETNNKLDNISGELSNINNNLTTVPDVSDTTITNEDITSNLDFEFEEDPYTNFWLELTTGLSNAFTNSKREINIQFRDKTHIISLDNFTIQIPSALKPFLTIISTVFITWKMLQYIKIIIDNISSGNIDEVLEMNEEEGITNLF